MADQLTRDSQWQIGDDAIPVLGVPMLGAGTPFPISAVDGLGDVEVTPEGDYDLSGAHGEVLGPDWHPGRTVRLTFGAHRGTPAEASQAVAQLAGLWRARQSGLTVVRFRKWGQPTRRILARLRRFTTVWDETAELGIRRVVADLRCPDHRILADVATDTVIGLASSGTSGNGDVDNDGTADAHVVLTLDGPWTNPRITNDTTGRAIRVDVNVPPGSELVIDTAAKTVRLDGADVYGSVRADNQWWTLEPGTNTITATRALDDGTASTQLTVTHRHSWVSA